MFHSLEIFTPKERKKERERCKFFFVFANSVSREKESVVWREPYSLNSVIKRNVIKKWWKPPKVSLRTEKSNTPAILIESKLGNRLEYEMRKANRLPRWCYLHLPNFLSDRIVYVSEFVIDSFNKI